MNVTQAFQEYPKMLYAPDGRQRVVHNADDEAIANEELGIEIEDAPKLSLKSASAPASEKPKAAKAAKVQKGAQSAPAAAAVAPEPAPASREAESGKEAE